MSTSAPVANERAAGGRSRWWPSLSRPWGRSGAGVPWMIAVPAVAVALLMLGPIVYLVVRASSAGAEIWPLIFRMRTAEMLFNTALLAGSVGAATTVLAVPLAWLTTRSDLPGRKVWDAVLALPLAVPSYAGAIAFVGMIGPRGVLQQWLEPLGVQSLPSIYGFFGAFMVLTLFTYPYVYLSARAALRGLDPSLEEASRGLGRSGLRTFFTCTLPQLRPSIGAGLLLVSLYTISDFGVVTLLRYDVFTRGIYTQYRAAFDRSFAAALGIMVVIFAIGLVVAEYRMRRRAAFYRTGSGAARAPRTVKLGRMRWVAFAYCGTIITVALGIPIFAFLYWLGTGTSAGNALDRLPISALNSLFISSGAAIGATLAAIPIAILAVRYQSRFSAIIERITYLGYGLPGIVIALAFVFFGARFMNPLYQTFWLLAIALVVRFLPQAVGAVRAAMLQISPRVEEASRNLGRPLLPTMFRVTLPLAAPGIASGAMLVFLTTIKELPITLLLAPTGMTTLSTEIWNATDGAAYGRAAAPALLIIALSIIPLLYLGRRGDRTPPV